MDDIYKFVQVHTETELCSFATQCVIVPSPERGNGDNGGKGDHGGKGDLRDDNGGKSCALVDLDVLVRKVVPAVGCRTSPSARTLPAAPTVAAPSRRPRTATAVGRHRHGWHAMACDALGIR